MFIDDMFLKCRSLSVTIIMLQALAVLAMSRSKSSIGNPAFLNLNFSAAYSSIAVSKGMMLISCRNLLRMAMFLSLFEEHSTPYFSSATVISEI